MIIYCAYGGLMGFAKLIGGNHFVVHDSELKDAAAVQHSNYNDDDFTVTLTDDKSLPSTGIGPVTGSVTVMYNPSGKQRTYKAGHNSAWPAEFQQDLTNGFYK
jgi:hypothetical protein